jgi:hypothetical protein
LKPNPVISLAIAGLLIVSLVGQAAASFRMACQSTAVCCCRHDQAMPAMGHEMAPMKKGCCETSFPPTCDLAGPLSLPPIPFLPTVNTLGPEMMMTLTGAPSTISDAADVGPGARKMPRPPFPDGPPTYLLTQTFLC